MNDMLFTPDEFLSSMDGFRLAKGARSKDDLFDVPISSVCADSREAERHSIFFALPGERTDGHRFIEDAFRRGASSAVAQVKNLSEDPSWFLRLSEPMKRRVIFTENTQEALQKSAAAWLAKFPNLKRIGVTGSCGKTTTKELTASILSCENSTVKNPGNRNSTIGLALSLFNVRSTHRYGVFEMGISSPGEMDILADMYRPQRAVVTNIGSAHIGTLGSMETTAKEKGKILGPSVQLGYIHEDCPWTDLVAGKRGVPVKFFGARHTGAIDRVSARGLSGWVIRYRGKMISYPLIGYHNLVNAYCAVTLAEDLGISYEAIAAGLESISALEGRGRVIPGSVTVIEDCYNANADSMETMLSYIRSLHWRRGRIGLVLGSMKELGPSSQEYHRKLGEWISSVHPAGVFLYGSEMEQTSRVLAKSCSPERLLFTDDFVELQREASVFVRPGDLVLIKGSRSMEMERMVPALCTAV